MSSRRMWCLFHRYKIFQLHIQKLCWHKFLIFQTKSERHLEINVQVTKWSENIIESEQLQIIKRARARAWARAWASGSASARARERERETETERESHVVWRIFYNERGKIRVDVNGLILNVSGRPCIIGGCNDNDHM